MSCNCVDCKKARKDEKAALKEISIMMGKHRLKMKAIKRAEK
jgi:hypothetical protein